MKKLLFAFILLFACRSYAQTYAPNQHIMSSTATGYSNGTPPDARSMYYDNNLFKYRDFQSLAEVKTYLYLNKYRKGHFPIYVHSGGVLSSGEWTGGITLTYWFKDGVTDNDLVLMNLLPPVGNTASRPSSPAVGTQYFNTDLPGYQYYNGSSWINFSAGSGLSALATPSSNIFTAGSTSGTQSWNDVSNEIGFYAEIATNNSFSDGLATSLLAANTTSKTWSGLTDGITYYTRVRAIGDNVNYSNSATSNVSSSTHNAPAFDTNFTGKFVALYSMSIGAGIDATAQKGWFWILNNVYKHSLGDQNNHAVSGKRLQRGDSAAYACGPNYFNFATEVDKINNPSNWAAFYINYGTNELLLNLPSITADSFEELNIKLVNRLVDSGAALSKIVILSPPYIKTTPAFSCAGGTIVEHDYRTQDFELATENAAKRKGVIFIPLYQKMYNSSRKNLYFNGGETVHPNDTGHWDMAKFIVNDPYAVATGNPKLYRPWPLVATGGSASASLHWRGVRNATSYDVVYSTSSTFTSPVTVNSADTVETIAGLSAGTPYYFKVIAKASGYVNSDYDSTSATPSASVTDTDATNFINAVVGAGGTLTSGQQSALHTCYNALKTAGVYTKIDAAWLPTFSVAAACKFNMKNPVNTDGAHRMTFHGTNNFSSTGVSGNGTTGYLNPHIALDGFYSDDIHLSVYQSTSSSFTGCTWNNSLGGFTAYTLIPKFSNGNAFAYTWNGLNLQFSVPTAVGFTLANNDASLLKLYKNGASLGSVSSTGHNALANDMYINAQYENTDKIQFLSIGRSLDSTQVAAFNAAITALLASF